MEPVSQLPVSAHHSHRAHFSLHFSNDRSSSVSKVTHTGLDHDPIADKGPEIVSSPPSPDRI